MTPPPSLGLVAYSARSFGHTTADFATWYHWLDTCFGPESVRFIQYLTPASFRKPVAKRRDKTTLEELVHVVDTEHLPKLGFYSRSLSQQTKEYGRYAAIYYSGGPDHPMYPVQNPTSVMAAGPTAEWQSLDALRRALFAAVQHLNSPYAIVTAGNDHEVMAEMMSQPFCQWDQEYMLDDPSTSPGHVARFMKHRYLFGNKARGAYWGNVLGPHMVETLGGRDRVLAEAPVAMATPLANGSVYLQATAEPIGQFDLAFQDVHAKLETYLAPILPWTT